MGKTRRPTHQKERGLRITALMARDGMDCGLCGEKLDRRVKDENSYEYVTFDHIEPLSKGGLDIVTNIRLTHQLCNNRRGSRDE